MNSKNKILIIIFTIGVLSFQIANGTWAYSHDTIASKGNKISIGYAQLLIDGDIANTGEFKLKDVIPSSNATLVKTITLQNIGTSNGKVFVQFIPMDGTFNHAGELTIMIGDVALFSNNTNMASDPVYLSEIPPESIITPDLVYIYTGNKNNRVYKFDLVFSTLAVH